MENYNEARQIKPRRENLLDKRVERTSVNGRLLKMSSQGQSPELQSKGSGCPTAVRASARHLCLWPLISHESSFTAGICFGWVLYLLLSVFMVCPGLRGRARKRTPPLPESYLKHVTDEGKFQVFRNSFRPCFCPAGMEKKKP